ncbi:MAG: hypothetical protein MK240_03935 [Opitutales bacterium]|nr:hypothetical protein [Opitutales bacterium]
MKEISALLLIPVGGNQISVHESAIYGHMLLKGERRWTSRSLAKIGTEIANGRVSDR